MMKEDVVPTAADRPVYNLAPIVFLIPCMLIFATIPFAPGLGVADLNIGILFFLAVSSMEIVGLFMAGWGSNNKYALLSAMRAVNQIISYDLPFIFSALVPVLLAGSLKLSDIAAAQAGGAWFVFYPVIGQLAFLAFIVSTLAAENRVPFDILEAESELVAGFRVEYSGMKFALIQLGEYAHIIGSSFLGALLFLGAWAGPGLSGSVRSGSCSRRCSCSCCSPGSAGASSASASIRSSRCRGRCCCRRRCRCSSPRRSSSSGGPVDSSGHRAGSPDTSPLFVMRAVAKAMRVTLLNLFRKPVTVHYPDKERAYPDRYRGLLALVYEQDTGEEACIGCRLCEFVCPPAVIKVEMLKSEKRNYAKTFTLELYACEFCELCVQVCPTDAIVMMKSFDMATTDRREMLLDKDRLHAIGLQHQPSWATGNQLRDMQGPPKKARAEHARRAAAQRPGAAKPAGGEA